MSKPAPLPSFTCPECGRVSYHPEDVANRYCGACHAFEDDLVLARKLANLSRLYCTDETPQSETRP